MLKFCTEVVLYRPIYFFKLKDQAFHFPPTFQALLQHMILKNILRCQGKILIYFIWYAFNLQHFLNGTEGTELIFLTQVRFQKSVRQSKFTPFHMKYPVNDDDDDDEKSNHDNNNNEQYTYSIVSPHFKNKYVIFYQNTWLWIQDTDNGFTHCIITYTEGSWTHRQVYMHSLNFVHQTVMTRLVPAYGIVVLVCFTFISEMG